MVHRSVFHPTPIWLNQLYLDTLCPFAFAQSLAPKKVVSIASAPPCSAMRCTEYGDDDMDHISCSHPNVPWAVDGIAMFGVIEELLN